MVKAMNRTRYRDQLRARAVQMVLDHEREYSSRSAAIWSISQKVGCSRESVRIWVKQHETDTGERDGLTTAESAWRGNRVIERLWRSLKSECVCLNAFETGSELRVGIGKWPSCYKSERPHAIHSLPTPDEAHETRPAAESTAA